MKTKIALLSTLALRPRFSQLTGCTSAYLASKKDVTLIETRLWHPRFDLGKFHRQHRHAGSRCGAFSSIIHINNTSTNSSIARRNSAPPVPSPRPTHSTPRSRKPGCGQRERPVQTNDAGGGTVVKTKAPTFIDVRPGN